MKHEEITEKIIKAAYTVHNTLGYGFLEKVYENAMIIELKNELKNVGINANDVKNQVPIKVYYRENIVGDYICDILVNDKVIVEIKAVETVNKVHETQLVNYLAATNIEVGLLLNFGPSLQIKRKVFDNDRKKEQKKNSCE